MPPLPHLLPILSLTLLTFATPLRAENPTPSPSTQPTAASQPATTAAPTPPITTADQARQAAQAYLTAHPSPMGKFDDIQSVQEEKDAFWLIFKTPASEIPKLGRRTLVVQHDGKIYWQSRD